MSYELFHQIETMFQSIMGKNEQHYFWTDEWQTRIREGEADILAGRVIKAAKEDIEAALEWLDQ